MPVFDILSKLPIKSILRFRAVCKSWYAILSKPELLHTDLFTGDSDDQLLFMYDRSCGSFSLISFNNPSRISPTKKLPPVNGTADSVGYSSITIAGCCNGIVLVLLKDGLKLCLWNPSTEETKVLPELTVLSRDDNDDVVSGIALHYVGFCFDAKTSDFKVILVFCSALARETDFVYSLRSDSWKLVEPRSPCYACIFGKYDIAMNSSNGMCHWFGSYSVGKRYYEQGILSFDANREKFKTTVLPYHHNDWEFKIDPNRCFFMLKEYVAMFHKERKQGTKTYEIWVMLEVGVKESWIKVMNIEPTLPFDKILRFWNGKIFLERYGEGKDRTSENGVVIFDPFTGKISPFMMHRNLHRFRFAANYKKSQVQLREQVEHHDTEKFIFKRPRTN